MMTGKNQKLSPLEKEEKRREHNVIRDFKEKPILGGFTMIFPFSEVPENHQMIKKYDSFLDSAQEFYESINIGRKR